MKKKIFGILICSILAFSMTGCKNSETNSNLDDNKNIKEDNKKTEAESTEVYGKLVNYTPNNGDSVKWKVFYKDDENIYLIAADFIETVKAPIIENSMSVVAWKHKLTFDIDLKNIYKELNPSMNKNVKKWLSSDFSNVDANQRAVNAYLLDTEKWNAEYGNSEYSEYVIGTPTMELYTASWNSKGYKKLYYNFDDNGAYLVGTTQKPSTYFIDMSSTDGKNDPLYYPDTTQYSEVHGYWLAAPSANTAIGLMSIKEDGMIEDSSYTGGGSIRPIVCLKSGVSLVKSKTEGYDYDLQK